MRNFSFANKNNTIDENADLQGVFFLLIVTQMRNVNVCTMFILTVYAFTLGYGCSTQGFKTSNAQCVMPKSLNPLSEILNLSH